MAIDTEAKRRRAITTAFGMPWMPTMVIPDGSVDRIDRAEVLRAYQVPAIVAPTAGFTVTPSTGKITFRARVTDTSSSASTYSYDWGDGSVASTDSAPWHDYTSPGSYTITQTVTNASGSDSTTQAVTVTGVTVTQLGGIDIGGDGEVWASVYRDKLWMANGNKNVKVEDDNVYQIGLDAPTGVTAAGSATGGTLAAGVYKLFAVYTRDVSGGRLYSTGQSIADVTLSGATSKITISNFADPSDAQVTHKSIFMTDAGGSTYYFYGEVADGGGTSFDITGTGDRNAAIVYSAVASGNNVPAAFTYLHTFDNRVFGSIENVLWYSLQAGTAFDLERFKSLNFVRYPFDIQGIFSLGAHLYINTPGGIFRQPFGDVGARFEHVEKKYYFKYPRTVQNWGGALVGLTEDGVRIFDGEKMSAIDISRDVKTEIEKIYAADAAGFKPCGVVYRRSFRTEYHLSYRDDTSATHNNKRLVLNLDRLQIFGGDQFIAPWEIWTNGANYLMTDVNEDIFFAQNGPATMIVGRERSDRYDSGIYVSGAYAGFRVPQMRLLTGTFVNSMKGKVRWDRIHLLAQIRSDVVIQVRIVSNEAITTSKTITTDRADQARFGIARFGVSRFTPNAAIYHRSAINRKIKGYPVYFLITQDGQDDTLDLQNMVVDGVLTESRFT